VAEGKERKVDSAAASAAPSAASFTPDPPLVPAAKDNRQRLRDICYDLQMNLPDIKVRRIGCS
jgi:hypothetical protein